MKKNIWLIAAVLAVILLLAYTTANIYEKPVFKTHRKNITSSPIIKPTPISMPIPQMWDRHIESTIKLPMVIPR
jgi:peptidoglycan/LPS O-acetylase OafA/YrhL